MYENCQDSCADLLSIECQGCSMLSCPLENLACFNGGCTSRRCGDGTCQPEEDCTGCPSDCGDCPESCGNGTCEVYEDCETCSVDCGTCWWCGDGYCDMDEDCSTCAEDCGSCPFLCGDGMCEHLLGESCSNCPTDCECGALACGRVLLCVYTCMEIVLCPNTCLEQGCYEAQLQGEAVTTCMIDNCLVDCIVPSAPGCQSCMVTSCGSEALICLAGTCS
jgi:hypothetical protein